MKEEHLMLNFTFYNPTKIVFGKGTIAEIKNLIPESAKVTLTFGGGSIPYTAVLQALSPDRWLADHPEHRLERREEESREAQARRRRERTARRLAVAQ